MNLSLPTHPSLRHPLTGAPLRALYVDKHGRARYPMMGAAPDDPPADPPADPPQDPPADPPAAKGYPEGTKPEDMSPDQQAAYYRDLARKHEDRNKDLLKLTGGKYGDALKAELEELDKLRTAGLSDAERQVEEAKRTAVAEVTAQFATKLAAAEFRAALAHVDGERREQIIEGLALSNYLTDSGDVDTDKVRAFATAIAPADKGTGSGSHDYGAGRRGAGGASKSGVAAGREMYAASQRK